MYGFDRQGSWALADPKLRDLFGPLLAQVGANVEDPISALLQHLPIRAWVDGKITIGIRGFNVTLKKAESSLTIVPVRENR